MPKKKTKNKKTKVELKKISAREKAKTSARKFKQEVKKAISTAIVAAFGFLIALSWRDVITEWIDGLTKISPVQGKLISAIIVTIIAVIGILVVTKIFSEKKE